MVPCWPVRGASCPGQTRVERRQPSLMPLAVMQDSQRGGGREWPPTSHVICQLGVTDALAAGDTPFRSILVLVNETDTFKLLALALQSGTTSIPAFRTRALPQWLGWLGVSLFLALIIGGLAFVVNNGLLNIVLIVSLPLLLIWVAAVSLIMLGRKA
jgi:hypothetical protein